MKTFITGSKDLTDYFFIQKKLKRYDISEIVIIQDIDTSSLAHKYANFII